MTLTDIGFAFSRLLGSVFQAIHLISFLFLEKLGMPLSLDETPVFDLSISYKANH
jgi:hypothetical protein